MAWSTAQRRPNSENARPRARRSASPTPSSQCTTARGGAGPSKKMATPTTECEIKLLEGRRVITNELTRDQMTSWREQR